MEDEYMEGIDEYIRSNTTFPVYYYYLRERLTHYGFGCLGNYGCYSTEDGTTVIGSRLMTHRHELIHASSARSEHRLLEEGLAMFLGTDLQWAGIADPLDIRAAFDSVEGSDGGLPGDYYPVAGHFISHLVDQHGLPAVVDLVQASDLGMTLDELSALSTEMLGQDLHSAIDEYEASGPGCEVAQYSPTWFQCDLAPPSIPIFTCGADDRITVDVSLSCADGASGVQDGMIWRDVLIDAPQRAPAVLALEEGHPVELVVRACGNGCDTPFVRLQSEPTSETQGFQNFEVAEGLNLIRIIKPAEAEGRVRFSLGVWGCS